MVAKAVEDSAHIIEGHLHRKIGTIEYNVGNVKGGHGGGVPCHPNVRGHCPSAPWLFKRLMVCTSSYNTAIRTVEYSVGNVECGHGGVSGVYQGDQAVSCHPLGAKVLPRMPHGDPRC
eukprot:3937416-Prymnesium_polylepis.1